MTPRPLVEGGLRGPAQDRFPEGAKEAGRNLGLTGEATILINESVDDGGGAPKSSWVPGATVRARIDPLTSSSRTFRSLMGDAVTEETSHIVSFDAGTEIDTDNRIEMNGQTYAITAKLDRTDPLLERVGVKGVSS